MVRISRFSRSTIGARRFRRREHSPPGDHLEPGQPGLVDRGNVGRRRGALRAAGAEGAQLARFHVRHSDRDRHQGKLHLVREQRGDRGADSLVGNVRHLRAGERQEKLSREVRQAARTRRAVVQFPRRRAGVGDELAQVLSRQRRRHDDEKRRSRGERDGHEVAYRVVGKLAEELRGARERGEREEQRVAVRRALGDMIGADDAGARRAVLDHEALPEPLAQMLR